VPEDVMRDWHSRNNVIRVGFTLIELLVVMAIIAVIFSLTLVAVQRVREAAARASCSNNLRQLALASQMYHDQHSFLPPSRIEDSWATWAVLILPYLDQGNSYRSWDLSRRFYEQPDAARLVHVTSYFCPSRRTSGGFSLPDSDHRGRVPLFLHTPGTLSDYAVCGGSGGGNNESSNTKGAFVRAITVLSAPRSQASSRVVTWRGSVTLNSITDGLSQTLFFGDKHIRPGQFEVSLEDSSVFNGDHTYGYVRYAGKQIDNSVLTTLRPITFRRDDAARPAQRFGSWHSGVCQFAFGDGSVRPINNRIDLDTLTHLADRSDGLSVGNF
jgi:prepilin-type N-terminal cleavage/methylation domain-containing protein/prepilin-type processing-associated H-X9-DG protein